MPRAARPKPPQPPAPVAEGPDPHLHAGKCTICKHPQRAEIERALVDWCSPLTKTPGLSPACPGPAKKSASLVAAGVPRCTESRVGTPVLATIIPPGHHSGYNLA
jgi:hypothetical protein